MQHFGNYRIFSFFEAREQCCYEGLLAAYRYNQKDCTLLWFVFLKASNEI